MRAALLPTPGDPFMLAYWLRNYETWRSEVDELVVYVNGQTDPSALEFARSAVEGVGGRFHATPYSAGHDGALRWLVDHTDAEYVVLCEDDAYVRKPEAVGAAFARIETGQTDIVGSPRHEDYAGQTQEWGEFDPSDRHEFRHGLWPTFLFIRRADLLATDRQFGDRAWWIGERIAGLTTVTAEDCLFVGVDPRYVHLDTLFATTFQLRAMGLRTDLVHHVRLYDAKATEEWIAEDPPWFHVTGLSTLPAVLNRADPATLPDMDEHGGLWTRRVAWWLRTAAGTPRVDVLLDFAERAGIGVSDIADWQRRFDRWEALVPA